MKLRQSAIETKKGERVMAVVARIITKTVSLAFLPVSAEKTENYAQRSSPTFHATAAPYPVKGSRFRTLAFASASSDGLD